MAFHSTSARRRWFIGTSAAAALILVGLGGMWLAEECDVCEAATTILLQSTVATNCTVSVTTDPGALNLPLTTAGVQRVQVGAAEQSCNKKVGYTLDVTSANCSTGTAGAKVLDAVSAESLAYSVEFTNPTTGGSTASVTGLLASACTGQTGRNVTDWKANVESSTVFVNFTGIATLAAGTYQDTLTLTMNVK